MKHIVVLSGAGISAESGISTFRDSNGLWENHRIEDVASPEGFRKNPKLVLDFYNLRRAQMHTVAPNDGHIALGDLEKTHKVTVITQNVDNLHERGGSTNVVHLHGELLKVRSTRTNEVFEWQNDLNIGDVCPKGAQLRPHIVWFGESVPKLPLAAEIAATADEFWIIGTSMQVYPAAGLIDYIPQDCPVFYIDPQPASIKHHNLTVIAENASTAARRLVNIAQK
ncbi:MAG: hypothetical protein RI894_2208 [Bacteroidota bacterium]|jgi:NAD-dependent deacetylase